MQQKQCEFDEDKIAAEISGVVSIRSGSESDLLAAVATVGPIAVGVDASSKSFMVSIMFYPSAANPLNSLTL